KVGGLTKAGEWTSAEVPSQCWPQVFPHFELSVYAGLLGPHLRSAGSYFDGLLKNPAADFLNRRGAVENGPGVDVDVIVRRAHDAVRTDLNHRSESTPDAGAAARGEERDLGSAEKEGRSRDLIVSRRVKHVQPFAFAQPLPVLQESFHGGRAALGFGAGGLHIDVV